MNVQLSTLASAALLVLVTACGGPQPAPQPSPSPDPAPGGSVPAQVQGEWQAGEASPIGYYDPSTGAWQGATGSSFIMKVYANGTYAYTGLLAVGSGSCQSRILSTERGTAAFSGDLMTFTPLEGEVQSTVCGGPVQHAPVTPTVRRWALSVDDYGKEALFTQLQDTPGTTAFYRTDRPGQTFPKIGISGRVNAPEGRSAAGTLVVACYAEDPNCASPATKIQPVTVSGTFSFPALEDRPYTLNAIQDTNGNGKVDSGDLVDVYSTTDAPGPRPSIRPPTQNVSVDLVNVN
ncbi:hypothetical protein [Deinococcus radiotolerans]|uniref:EF-hand domain-containing protein n=1 Tax=Deinococcus radiotolerans TaxID=1309407 RepID=A0ABQ2FHI7_9DEIO|nr:hypothetical protein [Deinococcus radiotolerans]GGK95696.1 hypothetical protein GCM10010844_12710 [Deinococcus radiotolerans]